MKIICKTDRTTSGFEELLGHGCKTLEEKIDYVQRFGHIKGMPDFLLLLADDSFDCGEWV